MLEAVESGTTNHSELSRRFKIDRKSIRRILKSKDAINNAVYNGRNFKRAKLRPPKHEELEEILAKWLKNVRSQNVPVSGMLVKVVYIVYFIQNSVNFIPISKEKAQEIAEYLEISEFNVSQGWLTRFKDRHSIVFKTIQGEAGAVDFESLRDWQEKVLKNKISKFSPDDIFNADETGLFYHLLPNKTMAFKSL